MEFTKHVQVRKEKFGTVIFETLKEKVFVTNDTGAEIVDLLKEGKNSEEIACELAEVYGTTKEKISNDVNCFIENMVAQEVLAK